MEMTMAIFVALAPAIAVALAGFFIEVVPTWIKWIKSVLQNESTTSWLIDLTHSVTLLGASVSGYLGAKEDSTVTVLVGFIWFVAFAAISLKLSRWLEELKKRNTESEFKDRHRKMAGAVRSIVRDEVGKIMRDTEDSQDA